MPKYYNPNGNIEVWDSKPQDYYTVEEWEKMHPTPLPPAPTPEEEQNRKLTELDSQYNSDKAILMSQYTEAVIDDDTDLMASVKAELTALREQYDKDYEDIIGGAE
jgi:hypothetical protein